MDVTDLLINMGVTVLLAAIKDEKKKAKIKAIARKVFDSLKAAYPDFT